MWLKNYNHTPTAPTSTFIFMQDFYTFLCSMVSLSHSCPLLKPVDRFICILAATLMQFKEWGRGGLELNPLPKHEIAPHCVTHLFERPMHQIDLTPMDFWLRPKEVAEFLNVWPVQDGGWATTTTTQRRSNYASCQLLLFSFPLQAVTTYAFIWLNMLVMSLQLDVCALQMLLLCAVQR